MARSPYSGRPRRAFWRGGMSRGAGGGAAVPEGIYHPRFAITRESRVFTAGSCFAQHVGRAMRAADLQVIDTEPAPRGMDPDVAQRFGYGLYSARFGNIYTLRQLRQLVTEASGDFQPIDAIWEREGRFFDALRPGVEPEGLASPDLVAQMRAEHLGHLARALSQADVMVFTLGLTEAWTHHESGTVYPTAPGTIAGAYDPDRHAFVNFDYADTLDDFAALQEAMDEINPDIRWLLTVSPVPLAATATDAHVWPATMRSKSVLRAAVDAICATSDRVDYFPSYELALSPTRKGGAFEEDLRSVRAEVVAEIMACFLAAHDLTDTPETPAARSAAAKPFTEDDAVCEDILLDAFRPDAPEGTP